MRLEAASKPAWQRLFAWPLLLVAVLAPVCACLAVARAVAAAETPHRGTTPAPACHESPDHSGPGTDEGAPRHDGDQGGGCDCVHEALALPASAASPEATGSGEGGSLEAGFAFAASASRDEGAHRPVPRGTWTDPPALTLVRLKVLLLS